MKLEALLNSNLSSDLLKMYIWGEIHMAMNLFKLWSSLDSHVIITYLQTGVLICITKPVEDH